VPAGPDRARPRDNALVARAAQIRVRLTPRAEREQIKPGRDGGYLARVTAPPVDGRDALTLHERLLA
jgi:uncharacterized protein YggU (UPF0235/DUF167 family)